MKLYVGSGAKQKEGYVSVDIRNFGINSVWDIRKGYWPWEDEEIEAVWAENFLEHLDNAEAIKFLNDTWEVLKKTKGELYVDVPSIHREGAYSLPHKTFYAERTFEELEKPDQYVYGIKNWKIKRMITNHKGNIHCWLTPIERVYDRPKNS